MKNLSLMFSVVLLLAASHTTLAAPQDGAPKDGTPKDGTPNNQVAAAEGDTQAAAPAVNPKVTIETSLGTIVAELYADKAPKTVENFLSYARSGYFDGTIFHRVMKGFMIQGGGFTADMVKKPIEAPIQNEADNGLKNLRGTLAMARTRAPHSASSQFYINHVDNESLDHRGKNVRDWGYAVFGNVVKGMDVVDAIAAVKTGNRRGMQNVPFEPVTITKVTVQGDS